MARARYLAIFLFIIAILILTGIYMSPFWGGPSKEEVIESLHNFDKILTVSVNGFGEGDDIASKYTCDGEDINPEVSWSGLPENTKSIMIVMYDPDAPIGYFIHWVIYNLPPNLNSIPEGISSSVKPSSIGKEARNDFGRIGYGGPCPPPGPKHRYFFIVLALDSMLEDVGTDPIKVIEKAKEHIIGYGETYVRYGR